MLNPRELPWVVLVLVHCKKGTLRLGNNVLVRWSERIQELGDIFWSYGDGDMKAQALA